MIITKYAVVEDSDEWGDEFLYDDVREARAEAQRRHCALLEISFEYSDTELVEDYRNKVDREPAPCACCDSDPCVHADEHPDGAPTSDEDR